MAISNKLATMDYNDFVGAHGGRRTKALAGRFRKAKGMQITPEMAQAIQREAQGRNAALLQQGEIQRRNRLADTMNGDESVYLTDPGKPLPGITDDMLGPPDAPRVGGRTQPGTTPRPGFNPIGQPKLPGAGPNWWTGRGIQTQPEWPPTNLRPRIPGMGTSTTDFRPRIPGQGTRGPGVDPRKRKPGQGTRQIKV